MGSVDWLLYYGLSASLPVHLKFVVVDCMQSWQGHMPHRRHYTRKSRARRAGHCSRDQRWQAASASCSSSTCPAGLWLLVAALVSCSIPLASAAPPVDLTNFQNEYPCDPNATLIVRPRTHDDVAQAVALHDKIMTVANGHSWNQPFFCVTPGAPLGDSPMPPSNAQQFKIVSSAQGPSDTTAAAAAAAGSSNITLPRPSSANIVMATIRPLNITVNETDQTAWVDAGITTIDLLDYLGNYVTPTAPAGYTLGAFPWFVYQTIGGAAATGTHGSSMEHKSISNQVVAYDVILANGTRKVFTNETDPFLMKAMRVSVGKLGVITRLKMKIVPEIPVKRTLKALTPVEFLKIMTDAQDTWDKEGRWPAWMNETQIFWVVQKNQFFMISFTRADSPDPVLAQSALVNFTPDNTTVFSKKGDLLALGELVLPADAHIKVTDQQVTVSPDPSVSRVDLKPYTSAQKWLDGFMTDEINAPVVSEAAAAASGQAVSQRTLGARWTVPTPKPPSGFYGAANMAEGLMEISRLGIQQIAGNLTAEPNSIYIKQPKPTLQTLRTILYDQYEVSIPLAAMGTCWAQLLDVVYQGDLLGGNTTIRAEDKGFRTAPLIRFIGKEDGLLSHTHDGPRMYLNIEDYLFYNRGRKTNDKFKAVMATLRGDPACTSKGPARLHWGKAGWPDPGCWHGDEQYGTNWCHFGCAAKQLDPTGKFTDSAPDRWTWAGVDLDKCCGPDGILVGVEGCECWVKHARNMTDCPPAPFYTYR